MNKQFHPQPADSAAGSAGWSAGQHNGPPSKMTGQLPSRRIRAGTALHLGQAGPAQYCLVLAELSQLKRSIRGERLKRRSFPGSTCRENHLLLK